MFGWVGRAVAELAALTGFRLFHNHLTVDLVTAVLPRETEPWARLIRSIRRDVMVEAARQDIDIITTIAWRGNEEQLKGIRMMLEPVEAGGGTAHFMQLICSAEELVRRVRSESRLGKKLTDPAKVLELYDPEGPMPVGPHLHPDTTALSPRESVQRIATYYALPGS